MNIRLLCATAALAAGLAAGGAQAGTLFSYAGPTGPTETDLVSYFTVVDAVAGPGNVSFTLDGYSSLDGQNFFEDDFTLKLNGVAILSGTYNLGGGGDNVTFFQPAGSSVNNISGNGTDATFAGGQVLISTPLSLIAGTNRIDWIYASLPAPDHFGFQGLGDEAWGLENVLVTQDAVPEPGAWALMLVGFGGLGAMMRRRSSVALAA